MKKGRDSRSGFTLLEIMVALAIFAVLAGIAAPMLSGYLPTQRLEAAGRDVFGAVQQAKITAVRLNRNCIVQFIPGTYADAGAVGSYQIFVDMDDDWVYTAGTDQLVGAPETMPANVTLYKATFTDNGSGATSATNMIGFTSHGIAARSTAGQFVFGSAFLRNNRNRYIRIYVSPAGNVTLSHSGNGANWN